MSNIVLYEDKIAAELAQPTVAANLANALPPWLNLGAFKAQAAIMAANPPKDREGKPPTVLAMTTALLNCAQMGLIPGPSRHVAFINRKGVLLAQPQWQGLHFLFDLGGWTVTAHLVHDDDTFETENLGPDEFAVTKHSYSPFAERAFAFPGAGLVGAYAKGVNKETGEIRFRFVTMERIKRAIGATYTSNDDTPWRTDFGLMVAKTVYQQSAARRWFDMPSEVGARLALAVERDHEALEQLPQPTSVPRLASVAARIAAAAPKALPVEAAQPIPASVPLVHEGIGSEPIAEVEQPGFVDGNDRKAFYAELGRMGWDYSRDIRPWLTGKAKPSKTASAMTKTERIEFVRLLGTPTIAAAVNKWHDEQMQAPAPLPPQDEVPTVALGEATNG